VTSFFLSPVFRYCVFPLIGMLFRICVKCQEKVGPIAREEMAVGLEMMKDAILMLVTLMSERFVESAKTGASLRRVLETTPPNELSARVGVLTGLLGLRDTLTDQLFLGGESIFVFFVVLLGLLQIKNRIGSDGDGRPKLLFGIILPIVVALGAQAWVAGYFSDAYGCIASN